MTDLEPNPEQGVLHINRVAYITAPTPTPLPARTRVAKVCPKAPSPMGYHEDQIGAGVRRHASGPQHRYRADSHEGVDRAHEHRRHRYSARNGDDNAAANDTINARGRVVWVKKLGDGASRAAAFQKRGNTSMLIFGRTALPTSP